MLKNTDKQRELMDLIHNQAADKVMDDLIDVCAPQVRGAHDSDFVIVDDKAYIVYMANDIQAGEDPHWPYVYVAMSIVNLRENKVEKVIPFAGSEKVFGNYTLPVGACFVPRIIQRNDETLRCFFSSENPGKRQTQMWYIDFNIDSETFSPNIYKVKLKTDDGLYEMQPQYFYQHAVSKGFKGKEKDCGLYLIDGVKKFGNKNYGVLNNFVVGQTALVVLNEDMDTFELIGHFFEPINMKFTESAVNRLPDGGWLAISRQEEGNQNYAFSESTDGTVWTPHEFRDFVPNGTWSKPTFEYFKGVYYLGWQENTAVNGVYRSVFNVDVSEDCVNWERKYRFESDKSFQYPTYKQYKGSIYLTVTQGDTSDCRKERIMFGKME